MSKMRAIIVDVDGTLADNDHRQVHLQGERKNWAAYNTGMEHDKPITAVTALVDTLYVAGVQVIVCTGREECFRDVTEAWLARHGVRYEFMLMRGLKDYRSDDVIKGEMLEHLQEQGYEIWFVIDDRNSVVKMWRERGVTCLQCAEGDF